MTQDEIYMLRCMELARMGQYTAAPNPMVGSVIVHQGQIIGEGFHHHPGGPHAEVAAINRVAKQGLLKQSKLYVNLEPCLHYGRTPPCSDLIIEKQFPEVIIGTRDYNAEVNGKGIARLRAAGIKVSEGILESEAQYLNRRFLTFHGKKRPYITLKWAQSENGYMDIDRESNEKGIHWISQPESQTFSHQLRAKNQAILVGRKTVEVDDPSLDCRAFKGQDPIRIVIDPKGQISDKAKVFRDAHFLRFTASPIWENDRKLDGTLGLESLLDSLYEEGLQSVLIEGGAYTLQKFIDSDLWDEAWLIKGSDIIEAGLKAPQLELSPSRKLQLGKDQLMQYHRL
ncbi:MAG: bifunctional diaminohydroxyphosphoribosylaminopyrimidine deaminase/5-amino-6-(5-phosphoribosylamino)uracil reductase RibD [Bacteroidetes bacterium]|nr:bifunctional diaminohydroxyphosphoribosylaminopyrimidine deaminase/5-amino-6-(5-phosphoribosylamino)uracil reductase RibD [Bacteroidota bacterium]